MQSPRDKMYARYSETRPGCPVPTTPADLLSGAEVVFRRFMLPLLPPRKDARILDIGCGYGNFVYFLQREGYTGAMGVDLSAHQVEVGQRLGVLNLQHGDACDLLRERVGEFDFISAVEVLEHIPKAQVLDFLGLVHAALRPGGRLVCEVPNLGAFYSQNFFMDFTHETPFTAPSLKQVFELANFVNIRIWPMGPVAHGLKSAVRVLLWKAISGGLRFIQTVQGGPADGLRSVFTAAILASGDRP
jgi:SAM-dependent methyltransferase